MPSPPKLREIPPLIAATAQTLCRWADERGAPKDSCLLLTRLAQLTFERFGLLTRPTPVIFRAISPTGYRLQIGNPDAPEREEIWRGHMILSVRDRWLVDLTSDQANRGDLSLPRYLVIDDDEVRAFVKGKRGEITTDVPSGAEVRYEALDSPGWDDAEWRAMGKDRSIDHLAAAVRKQMRG